MQSNRQPAVEGNEPLPTTLVLFPAYTASLWAPALHGTFTQVGLVQPREKAASTTATLVDTTMEGRGTGTQHLGLGPPWHALLSTPQSSWRPKRESSREQGTAANGLPPAPGFTGPLSPN
jgi:hypothetical protein